MDPVTLIALGLAAAGVVGIGTLVVGFQQDRRAYALELAANQEHTQRQLEAPNRPIVDAVVASIHAKPRAWAYDVGGGEQAPTLFTTHHTIVYHGNGSPWGITYPLRMQFTHKEAEAVQLAWQLVCAERLLDGAIS